MAEGQKPTTPGSTAGQPSSGSGSSTTPPPAPPVVGVSRPPSTPQQVSQELKDKGLKSKESADTVTDKQFKELGKGQSLDLLRDSVEAHGEAARRARHGDEVGKGWKNPLASYVGADDSKPESGEFDPETGGKELKERNEKMVNDQQHVYFDHLSAQMAVGIDNEPITNAGNPELDEDGQPVEEENNRTEVSTFSDEAQKREAVLRKEGGSKVEADKEKAHV